MKDSFFHPAPSDGPTPRPAHGLRADIELESDQLLGRRAVYEHGQRRRTDRPARSSGIPDPAISREMVDLNKPRWEDLKPAQKRLRAHMFGYAPLVDFHRETDAARAFDVLRTRLKQTLTQNGWSRVAIAAPTSGAGTTFCATNLALSLARVPQSRTILMDMNLRAPGVAEALDLETSADMAKFLEGNTPIGHHMQSFGPTLALGLNGTQGPNAAECLHDPATGETLKTMRAALTPNVELYDLPALLAFDDLSAFLPQVDGVLLVSDGTETQAKHLAECERLLEGQTRILGVILNRARSADLAATA